MLQLRTAGTWIYAWCYKCGEAKEFEERVSAHGAPEEVTRWRCNTCRARRASYATMQWIKGCPRFQIPTEKFGDCGHIACLVPDCGAHWWFQCGLDVPLDDIYRHMDEAHGGWYGAGDLDDVDDEYQDDELM
ncbi:dihydroxyacid dehydratase [Niveomyces insectorum RCEF 264]|uniref:Dihydroxyacid dehydratase n=1 Tax=Niveomyces insectorum RCEF 264 TaxID=1081102 RepID=A0A167PXQ7_9HYPO|nr:dihydroxyacid dehydratase [Niveomyces insectorum RCEF 264]